MINSAEKLEIGGLNLMFASRVCLNIKKVRFKMFLYGAHNKKSQK